MSAEDIMRERLKEYQELLEMAYTYVHKFKGRTPKEEVIRKHVLAALRSNGIGKKKK